MKKLIEDMNSDELKIELERLKDILEDMEATFKFHLMHTSAHESEGIVEEHREEIEDYKARIEKVQGLIS